MNFRFFRRFRLGKHTLLNISKRGVSITITTRWLNITFGKNGIRFSSGIRGTGLSFSEYKKY